MSILSLHDGEEPENDNTSHHQIPLFIFGEKGRGGGGGGGGGGAGFETIQARYSSKASVGQARD